MFYLNTGVEHLLRDVKDTTISTLANEVYCLTIACLALQFLSKCSFVTDLMYQASTFRQHLVIKALTKMNDFL